MSHNIFKKHLLYMEADEDPPMDNPPDMGAPPDLDSGDDGLEPPPDFGDMGGDFGGFGDFGGSDNQNQGGMSSEEAEIDKVNEAPVDEKISSVMNLELYQKFLSVLHTIDSQLLALRDNVDIIYNISHESVDIIESLSKLGDNIRLYLSDKFINENYSSNLLFFNKCINLQKLLNDVFDKNIKKGLKE